MLRCRSPRARIRLPAMPTDLAPATTACPPIARSRSRSPAKAHGGRISQPEATSLNELLGDNAFLYLVGALAHNHQWSITEVSLDIELRRIPITSVDADGIQRHLHSDLGCEELGHTGLHVAALTRVESLGGTEQ